MSGTEWRFTDEQGVERTLTTQELRASLASGKIAPSTLVWNSGMKEFAPAFTLPEFSAAAIAAGRSSRASIPPTGTPATGSPALSDRPRSVPPPVPKRVPSIAPPVPVGKPHRPPMRTLTGLEPPELLESLGLAADGETSGIHDEATRDVTADGDEGWEDATDVIPLAPKVPKEAANLPRSIRRIPSIPPPPLPANPTPPPVGVAPAPEAPRRPTLMGLAQRKPSKPPPKRSGIPGKETPAPPAVAGAGDPERTVVAPAATAIAAAASALPNPPATGATTTSRSKPPPPLHRKPTDPGKSAATTSPATPSPATTSAGPKRLNKTLEIDTKLTEKALDRSKP
ncbi:MAG: DUF4339 domain-containing protein, partial [Polyangiaceae bacterium]|nr:DUF4339 domain-containing protein [Polyangiaceae bacterium]